MAAERVSHNTNPASELRSRAAPIIERAPLPIVEVRGDTHIVSYVNSAFCVLVGKTRGELVGKSFAEIVQGGDECVPILDRVYQTGEAATHAHEDGSEPSPIYWLYAMWPALDADERPEGVIIQLAKATDFRKNTVAINEALLIAGLRQHELTETAEKLNVQLQREIAERKVTSAALQEAKGPAGPSGRRIGASGRGTHGRTDCGQQTVGNIYLFHCARFARAAAGHAGFFRNAR